MSGEIRKRTVHNIRPLILEKEDSCYACPWFKKFKCQKFDEQIPNPLTTAKCRRK